MPENNLKAIIECLLFLSETPLPVKRLREIIPGAGAEAISGAIQALIEDFAQDHRGIELREVAGGFQIRSRPEFKDYVKRLRQFQPTRLSAPAMETLAIVAYKQPVLKAEIERLRGVEVGGILRLLIEKGLIRIVGRKNLPGRPIIYGTSRKFLELFDLMDLSALPTLEEFFQWTGESVDGARKDS
ncbi:MAG: SMC-Scp complex subunit ScpB [Deltaproteobacteria bacterium]|nr:SMC-Scp complex subunit ScpB [Deltaproteobacteria bacterium]